MHFTGYQQSTVPRPLPNCRPCSSDVSDEKTTLRGSTPRAVNRPIQNWWVDQRFRTRGTPTRRLARDGAGADSAERVLANHLGNVRVLTLDLLELRLHHAHLVDVLDEPLRTRVAADHALPALGQRHLAPRAPLGAGQLDVDERARAVDRAPLADGLGGRGGGVGQGRDRVEAAEARRLALCAGDRKQRAAPMAPASPEYG